MSDVRIIAEDFVVELWWIIGSYSWVYYPTKLEAEKAARQLFPDEPIDKREARVRYKKFVSMEAL